MLARRLQRSSIQQPNGEVPLGVLYGRTITLHQHTLADLPAQTTPGTSRFTYTVQQAADNVRLTYMNWYNSSYKASPYCTDNANTAVITVQALLFPPGSSTGTVVTVGGNNSWTIPAGSWVQTDPITLPVTTGQTFDVQTYVSGTQWYPTLISGGGFAANSNQATSGSSKLGSTAGVLYTPAIITGKRTGPAVLLLGDSIAYNSAHGVALGYIETGLVGQYGAINTSVAGDRLYWLRSGTRRSTSMSLFANADATTSVVEYGRNDLDDSRTLSQLQTDLLWLWTDRANAGQRVIQTTITPHSNSTDGWVTTGNQTVHDGTIESRRVQLNDWIRAGAPTVSGNPVAPGTGGALLAGQAGHPLYDYWEIADEVETARNSGIWRANMTTDGIHPNSTGISAAALGVNDSLIA